MTVIRSDHDKDNPYTMISNKLIADCMNSKAFKPADLGVMVMILSLPEDWMFSVEGLAHAFNMNRQTLTSSIQRLEKLGFIYRTPLVRGDNGLYLPQDWAIYETPNRVQNLYTDSRETPGRNRVQKTVHRKPSSETCTVLNTYIKDVDKSIGNEEGKYPSQVESTLLSESVLQVEDQQSKSTVVDIEGAYPIQWRNSNELCPHCGSLVMTDGKFYKCPVCCKSWDSLSELFGTHEYYP